MAGITNKLRHKVVIQKPVETQNQASGAAQLTWTDVASVWAAIEPISVRDLIAAQVESSEVNARIIIRYRNDVDHTCRIYHEYKNIYYDIKGIMSDKESGLEYLTIAVGSGVRLV